MLKTWGGIIPFVWLKLKDILFRTIGRWVDETVGGAPIWLSEFFENTPEKTANSMGMAIDAGVPAACYWNYVP